MVGNLAKDIPLMVTEDDFHICRKHFPISDFDICEDMVKSFKDTLDEYGSYRSIILMAIAFNVGRIQGIREQRAKKREAG